MAIMNRKAGKVDIASIIGAIRNEIQMREFSIRVSNGDFESALPRDLIGRYISCYVTDEIVSMHGGHSCNTDDGICLPFCRIGNQQIYVTAVDECLGTPQLISIGDLNVFLQNVAQDGELGNASCIVVYYSCTNTVSNTFCICDVKEHRLWEIIDGVFDSQGNKLVRTTAHGDLALRDLRYDVEPFFSDANEFVYALKKTAELWNSAV